MPSTITVAPMRTRVALQTLESSSCSAASGDEASKAATAAAAAGISFLGDSDLATWCSGMGAAPSVVLLVWRLTEARTTRSTASGAQPG